MGTSQDQVDGGTGDNINLVNSANTEMKVKSRIR